MGVNKRNVKRMYSFILHKTKLQKKNSLSCTVPKHETYASSKGKHTTL